MKVYRGLVSAAALAITLAAPALAYTWIGGELSGVGLWRSAAAPSTVELLDAARALSASSSGESKVGRASGSNVIIDGVALPGISSTTRMVVASRTDSGGNTFTRFDAPGNHSNRPNAVARSSNGSTVVVGHLAYPVTFGGSWPGDIVRALTTGNGEDSFLVQYKPGGALRFAKALGGSSLQVLGTGPTDVAAAPNGYITVVGTGDADFHYGGSKRFDAAGSQHLYVASARSGGNFRWAVRVHRDLQYPYHLHDDDGFVDDAQVVAFDNGQVLVGVSIATIHPGERLWVQTPGGTSSIWVPESTAVDLHDSAYLFTKFTVGGELLWHRWMFSGNDLSIKAIAPLLDRSFYFAGYSFSNVRLYGVGSPANLTNRHFLIRCTADADTCYEFRLSSDVPADLDDRARLATQFDGSHDVIVSWEFDGNRTLLNGSSQSTSLLNEGGTDIFTMKVAGGVSPQWVRHFGGPGDERLTATTFWDDDVQAAVHGTSYGSSVTFDLGSPQEQTESVNGSLGFSARLGPDF